MQFEESQDARVHSLYIKEEKALERAFHLGRQFPDKSFYVIRKTLVGRLKVKNNKVVA